MGRKKVSILERCPHFLGESGSLEEVNLRAFTDLGIC
jgi:hypothetical protein